MSAVHLRNRTLSPRWLPITDYINF